VALAHASRKLADRYLFRAGVALRFMVGVSVGNERAAKNNFSCIILLSVIDLLVAQESQRQGITWTIRGDAQAQAWGRFCVMH